MIKVKCDACGAPYEVDPRRIPKSGLKMRCPGCGASVQVHPGTAPTELGLPPAPAPKPAVNLDDLDLPALKSTATQPKPTAPAARAPAGLGFESTDLMDLPAVKSAQSSRAKLTPDLERAVSPDLEITDLPAPKGAPARVAANAARPPLTTDLDFDLPAPKKAAAFTALAPELDFDLPAPKRPAAAPLPMGLDLDLPAPKRSSAAKPTPAETLAKDSLAIDPEPFYEGRGVDLFGHLDDVQGRADTRGGITDLPAPADLPRAKATPPAKSPPQAKPFGTFAKDSLDLSQGFSADDLDLPAPADLPVALDLPIEKQTGGPIPGATFKRSAPGSKDRPAAKTVSPDFDLRLPEPSGSARRDTEQAARNSYGDGVLSLPSISDQPGPSLTELDELELDSPKLGGATLEIDPVFEPVAGAPRGRNAAQSSPQRSGATGGSAFGEIDFGLSNDALPAQLPVPMPAPIPQAVSQGPVEAAPASAPADVAAPKPSAKKKKKKKTSNKPMAFWALPLSLVCLLGVGGVGLGLFTEHGWFGVYLLEQFLPEAGDPAQVTQTIAQAEREAATDTLPSLRKSLVMLSEARNQAGLNRELLARSLLHEGLYQLRFGDDFNSTQRAVAILARVMERGTDVSGLTLARAAHLARTDLAAAKTLLSAVRPDKDPYRALVTGELALLDNQPELAAKAFEEAQRLGAGARATWGLARASLLARASPDAEAAAKATLSESPHHSAALVLSGEQALARGDLEAALVFAREASGLRPVQGEKARPSRAERARAFALEGRVEERREHPREAQIAYEQSLAADPLKLDVLIGSARILMRLGRAREALTRFDSALGAKPSESVGEDGKIQLVEAGVGSAQALLAQSRAAEALERLKALLAKFPDDFEINLWHGHALSQLEHLDDAEAAFKKAIQIAPKEFSGYVALSQLLFKRERPEEAARTLADATNKVQDSADVRRMLGNSELMRNHLPEAMHQFSAALRFDERDPSALFGLCVAQRKHGDIDAAEKTLARLEMVDPAFPGLPLERGQLRETRGDYAGAASAYQAALEERPGDNDLKLRLGAALVTAGRVDEADTLVREVLKELPTSAEAEHFMGRILFARHDNAQALQRFERAVNFDAMRAEYHMYLGWAHLEQGNLSGALNSVNTALERDPNLADAYWVLGRIQLRTGAVKDALGNFERALRLKPGRVEALAGIGDAYDQLREGRKAIKSYEEAIKLAPEHGDWWYRLGSLHLNRGSRDEARVALAEAVLRGDRLLDKPSWVADAHLAYAEVLRESGRLPEARDQYKTFLELAPQGHPSRQEVTQIIRASDR